MAELGPDAHRELRAANRRCGECSLCCTMLRVDELAKVAGCDCIHQILPEANGSDSRPLGCGIYAERPEVCRSYRCLWLQGGLEDDERPDRTGGIVDLEARGTGVILQIQEVRPGAFDASRPLQAIADRYREQMPVRIIGTQDLENPDRPFRVLLADGVEQRVEGEWVETWRAGVLQGRKRQGWAERLARRIGIWRRSRALARIARVSQASKEKA